MIPPPETIHLPTQPVHVFPCINLRPNLHLTLDLLQQLRQLALVRLLGRPLDAQSLGFVGLRNKVEMHVVDDLVGDAAVVLQDVVVGEVLRDGDLFGDGQQLRELVVGDVV